MVNHQYIGIPQDWQRQLENLPDQGDRMFTRMTANTRRDKDFQFIVLDSQTGKSEGRDVVGALEMARDAYRHITSEERLANYDRNILSWGRNTYLVRAGVNARYIVALMP